MPYWVKQYRDTKGLNLVSSTAVHHNSVDSTDSFSFSTPHKNGLNGSCLCLQLNWKQYENLSALSFVPSPSSSNGDTPQDERYVVTLTSEKTRNGRLSPSFINPYKLYSSKHRNKAEEAIINLQLILKHLVNIPLSQELLSLLILPIPKSLEELPYLLAQYTLKLPPASEEWRPLANLVIDGLPLVYLMCELTNMTILKTLHESGVNIAVSHPQTGATLVHLAAQTSDDSVRQVIDYLHDHLSSDCYQTHIDQPCREGENGLLPAAAFSRQTSSLQRASRSLSLMTEESILSVEKILRRSGNNSLVDAIPSITFKLQTATPLMKAIKRNCVRSVQYLLVLGASTNYQDPSSGVTALHLAASQSNVAIIKLLLSFGADLTLEDSEGRNPIDIARKIEALDCVQVMETIMTLRTLRDHKTCQETQQQLQSDSVTLLSIDGGGTRGSVCSYSLYYLEQRMRKISGNPDLQIREYFNWFSGTSIGAIFALCMSHAHLDTPTVMSVIVNNRVHALAGKRVYDGPTQETILHKYIGNIGMKDIKDPKVLVMTVRADLDPPKLIHVTNYREDPGDGREWKAWQAARASGAAPLFFPSYDQKYVDGGILATNPTQHALHDIHVYDGKKVGLVLSLGTGVFKPSSNESIDLVKPRLTHLVSDLQKDIKFLKSLKCMLTANIVNSEDSVQHSKCWAELQGGVFHRLSPPLTQRFELDEKSDEGFVLFFYETYLYLLGIDDQINDIARQLLSRGPQWKESSHDKPLFKSTWV